jgi:hypothetical protein
VKRAPWLLLLVLVAAAFTYRTTTSTFTNPTYQAFGQPIGSINISNSSSNDAGNASTPFQVQPDTSYLLECSVAACAGPGPYADCTYGGTNHWPSLAASTVTQIYVPPNVSTISAIASSGSGACDVWPVLR